MDFPYVCWCPVLIHCYSFCLDVYVCKGPSLTCTSNTLVSSGYPFYASSKSRKGLWLSLVATVTTCNHVNPVWICSHHSLNDFFGRSSRTEWMSWQWKRMISDRRCPHGDASGATYLKERPLPTADLFTDWNLRQRAILTMTAVPVPGRVSLGVACLYIPVTAPHRMRKKVNTKIHTVTSR